MATDQRINEFLMSRPEVHQALKTLVRMQQAGKSAGMGNKMELQIETQDGNYTIIIKES